MKPGVYVHIPFCEQRCYYCAFTVAVSPEETYEPYVRRLIREIELSGFKEPPETIFFGGGTPSIIDAALIEALHARGFEIGVETNGRIDPPEGMDWICVSPKAGAELVIRRGHELKLIYPQADAKPEAFVGLAFERFSLQPMDGPDVIENTARAIDYCLRHPQWRLSLQTHKTVGIR